MPAPFLARHFNDWKFDKVKVKEYLKKTYSAKIDVIEIGFRFLNSRNNLGQFATTSEKVLKNTDSY